MTGFFITTLDICNPFFPVSSRRLYEGGERARRFCTHACVIIVNNRRGASSSHKRCDAVSLPLEFTLLRGEMTQTRKSELISDPDEIN
jgi:hypothetical protein